MEKIDKKNIQDILALTPTQEGMLFHYLKEPGSDAYFEQLSLDIRGEIQLHLFEKAWNLVIETNEMLRTVFRWEKLEKPAQIILKKHKLQPKYYNLHQKNINKTRSLLHELTVTDRKEKFDLQNVPFRVLLYKTGKDKHQMIISHHHILYDGWSSGIILGEFLETYEILCKKSTLIPPVKPGFESFIRWSRNQDVQKKTTYWQHYLQGIESGTEISLKTRRGEKTTETGSYHFKLAPGVKDSLENAAAAHKVTPASLFYSTWGLLLQKINNCRDVVLGTTVSGRPANIKGIENVVGLFINTIPLRVRTEPNEKVSALLTKINDTLKTRQEYENASLVDIKEWIGITHREELFDSIVVLENYPLDHLLLKKNSALHIRSYSIFERTHYDLAVGISLLPGIEVRFVYNKAALDKTALEILKRAFVCMLGNILNNPDQKVSHLEIITREERQQVLQEFNNTRSDYPAEKTVRELFENRAAKNPDNTVISCEDNHLSYRALDIEAGQLASTLHQNGVTADTIVGLMKEYSIEMMVGIMGILKAGGAYLPIDPGLPPGRIEYMLKDSNVRVLVSEAIKIIGPIGPIGPIIKKMPNHLCYVIYTSGSTGKPKGVMIEHAQLVNFIYHMYNCYNRDFDTWDRCLSLTNITFDVSVCELFLPIVFGSRIVLLPGEKRADVYELAKTLLAEKITFAYIPPGLLRELQLELKTRGSGSKISLNKLLVGVEPIRGEVLADYLELNPAMLIVNGYGPTETTICSSTYRYRSHESKGSIVPIGRPLSNTTILLLDRDGHLVPVGVPGEICIAGDGVGRGYLNQPELTAERFRWFNRSYRSYRSYRTGDLGKWLPDGNIQFLGRVDHQVKIRGHRVELGEIENRLLHCSGIKKAVVMVREDENKDKYLCAYIAAGSREHGAWSAGELREYLSQTMPRYMIPSYFVRMEDIPVTPNGKIDRKALPPPEINTGKDYAAPQGKIEKKLVDLWSEVLQIEKENIGIDDNFFSLGGHSLKAARLTLKIHRQLDVKVPVNAIFEAPSIRGLAGYIKGAQQDMYVSLARAEKREYYPLSAAQKQFYITHHTELAGTGYNVQNLLELEGRLSKQSLERLEKTFEKLILRHESLRTSFEMIADEPAQRIHKEVEFKLHYFASDNNHMTQQIIRDFIKPFHLSRLPLLRGGLIKTGEETHILIIDTHHIAADDLSMSLLAGEFIALYRGEDLPPLKIQYKDFALWQAGFLRDPVQRQTFKRQQTYWLKTFAGDIPLLNLPLDYRRPAIRQYRGSVVPFELDRETAAGLKELALSEDVTPFILLLSVFNVLLSKICDQEDIPVGTPISVRRHADLEPVVGFFVNMLVTRNRPTAGKTFRDFLKEVKTNTLAAYENQDYPYEELVNMLSARVKRDPGRNALFDVVFVWEDLDIQWGDLSLPGTAAAGGKLHIKPYRYEKINAPFDLILTGAEVGEKMSLFINYSTSLFKRETIERIARGFTEVISGVVTNPDVELEHITVSYDLLEAAPRPHLEEQGDFGF